MFTPRLVLSLVLVLALLAPGAALAQPAASPASPAAPGAMLIVENAGQWPAPARFQVWNSPLGPGTTWLAEDAIWFVAASGRSQVADGRSQIAGSEDRADPLVDLQPANLQPATLHALKLTFPGSNPDVRIEPFGAVDTTVSYFLGDHPAQWRADVPVWYGVRYVDLYPGVDLVLSDDAWRLEAAPGAAIDQARIQIEGAEIVALDGATLQLAAAGEAGSLVLPTAPFPYRVMGVSSLGSPLTLAQAWKSRPSQPHQPADNPGALLYSTFLGGSGLSDSAAGVAIDGIGNAYVTGQTGSIDFPTTPGALDPSFNAGFYDAFVAKLNPAGSALVYATFLGGSGFYEGASDIAVDGMGNAYVIGTTESTDFPTTPGAFDTTFNGGEIDAFVAKLNPAGSALVYGTYLGSNGSDYAKAIAIDGLNNALLLGETFSSSFPTTPGACDTSHNGSLDVFVAKLNPAGRALAYSTFLGGNRGDEGYGLAVDSTGSAFVSGYTFSINFPATPGAYDPTFNGGPYDGGDAFVARLNPAGSALGYASFLGGGEGNDGGSGIAVDATGSAWVSGSTSSSDFPTTPGAFDPIYNGALDAFVARLNPAGSALVYATFLGTSGLDGAHGIAVDGAGNVFVAGNTNSADFPTTPDAFDASFNGGSGDVFLVKFNPSGGLLYGTFFGGSGSEGGNLAMDAIGIAYLAGGTNSTDFPTTPGAFNTSYNGGDSDAYVAKLNLTPYTPNVVARIEQPTAGAFVSGAVTLRGFAIDRASVAGTGIDVVHIYLDGPYGTGTIIGAATYGLDRPDIAAQYGARFGPSGWELAWDTAGLAPGVHRLYLYAHRTTDNGWSLMEPHLVIVPGGPARWLPIVLRQR